LEEFGERLRIIQLVRHPARVAASIVTHKWYVPGARADIEAAVALSPSDGGVHLREYQGRWNRMSEFEKALFFWAEVHLYGLEVEATFPAVPFARVGFEDLLSERDARAELARFLCVPYRPALDAAPSHREDRYRRQTVTRIDFDKVHSHPVVAGLARRFGYEVSSAAMQKFLSRYKKDRLATVRRYIRAALRKFAVAVGSLGAADVLRHFGETAVMYAG
jgi:hypothetical protein